MLRIAFAGFRHSHILALYTAVLKSTCAKIVGAYEADAALENGKHVIAAISSATPTSNPLGAGNEQRQTLRGGNRVE